MNKNLSDGKVCSEHRDQNESNYAIIGTDCLMWLESVRRKRQNRRLEKSYMPY